MYSCFSTSKQCSYSLLWSIYIAIIFWLFHLLKILICSYGSFQTSFLPLLLSSVLLSDLWRSCGSREVFLPFSFILIFDFFIVFSLSFFVVLCQIIHLKVEQEKNLKFWLFFQCWQYRRKKMLRVPNNRVWTDTKTNFLKTSSETFHQNPRSFNSGNENCYIVTFWFSLSVSECFCKNLCSKTCGLWLAIPD